MSDAIQYVPLRLAYFPQHNGLHVHPCGYKWQDFLLFIKTEAESIVWLHQFLYPFLHRGLCPYLSYCDDAAVNMGVQIPLPEGFLFLVWRKPRPQARAREILGTSRVQPRAAQPCSVSLPRVALRTVGSHFSAQQRLSLADEKVHVEGFAWHLGRSKLPTGVVCLFQ